MSALPEVTFLIQAPNLLLLPADFSSTPAICFFRQLKMVFPTLVAEECDKLATPNISVGYFKTKKHENSFLFFLD